MFATTFCNVSRPRCGPGFLQRCQAPGDTSLTCWLSWSTTSAWVPATELHGSPAEPSGVVEVLGFTCVFTIFCFAYFAHRRRAQANSQLFSWSWLFGLPSLFFSSLLFLWELATVQLDFQKTSVWARRWIPGYPHTIWATRDVFWHQGWKGGLCLGWGHRPICMVRAAGAGQGCHRVLFPRSVSTRSRLHLLPWPAVLPFLWGCKLVPNLHGQQTDWGWDLWFTM